MSGVRRNGRRSVQRQINENVRFANNEMLRNISEIMSVMHYNISELLDNKLADMQRNISEKQKAIAEIKQEAGMKYVTQKDIIKKTRK